MMLRRSVCFSLVGKPPVWLAERLTHYQRMGKGVGLTLSFRSHRTAARQDEDVCRALLRGAAVWVLDERGAQWDVSTLAHQLRVGVPRRDVTVVCGPPEGVTDRVCQRAHTWWSLSPLTLQHDIALLVAVEALFRAMAWNAHHPYHRE